MLTRHQIRNVLNENGIKIRKRLGQNFLINQKIQEKILVSSGIDKTDTVFEIGPGLGALTGELSRRANSVIAIEKDKGFHEILSESSSYFSCPIWGEHRLKKPSNLELIQGDVLKYRFERSGTRKLKVIGNLPYYISSPILIHILNNRNFIDTVFISVQQEFAERLLAQPGTKAYGAITCFVQFYSKVAFLFRIERSAFYPVPNVDSCFLKINIHSNGLYLTDEEKLFKIIRACFAKRRKKILNSLYSSNELGSKDKVLEKLKIAGISPNRRPETVSLEEFVKLTNTM